jgi:hypothetical protein
MRLQHQVFRFFLHQEIKEVIPGSQLAAVVYKSVILAVEAILMSHRDAVVPEN